MLGGEYPQRRYGRIMTEPHCRNAVDFGIPLLNNPRCAQLFVEALEKKIPQGGLRKTTSIFRAVVRCVYVRANWKKSAWINSILSATP